MSELEALSRSGEVLFVHDTLSAQIEELEETRAADRRLARDELAARARARAGASGDPFFYGAWVYYPWSRRLVHVLPEAEYQELRTSRNRNKITRAEQSRLAALCIGIAGLSVGQATAVTLALEGVGGAFRLADFDALSLSNMNRLRAGAHDLGVNKAVLAARQIFEIDPYAHVEVFERGISDDNMEAFFSGERGQGPRLDLLVEECDDVKMKFRLREEARRRGVPVVMETSDRGLVDVERFDREPSRPLFHGLAGDVDADRFGRMTTHEKLPVVLDIIGARTMSRRLAASLVDIDATLKTWPQLASAVALGGAVNADAARRIALGGLTRSGRFFVDLESIVSDAAALTPPAHELPPSSPHAPAASESTPLRLPADEPVTDAVLESLVRLAATAPSGGNCQPWRFTYGEGVLRCWHDEARSRSFLDFEHRATYVAFGALAENLRLAAACLGVGLAPHPFPDPRDPALVLEARLGGEPAPPTPEDAVLAPEIERRATNRRIAPRSPLRADYARSLVDVASRAGAELRLAADSTELAALGEVLGAGDRARLTSKTMHEEMMRELRWSPDEAATTRDGLDLATLELTPADRAGMRLVSDWSVMATLREIGGGQGLATPAKKAMAAASAAGLLVMPEPRPERDPASVRSAYFRGGAAMQRVWLMATGLGLALQPMTALVYLAARVEDGGDAGLPEAEREEIARLASGYRAVFGASRGGARPRGTEIMLFRICLAPPPSARSLRRHVSDLLAIER